MITDKMLEENTTPWGLLSEEMRNAFQDCNLKELEIYLGVSGWVKPARYTSLTAHSVTFRKKSTPLTKPEIPWDAIKDEYKWAARDSSGKVWIYTSIPEVSPSFGSWDTPLGRGPQIADFISRSLKVDPGTCDWKDSLVQRPD